MLIHQGLVCPVHADELQQVPPEHLQAWCVKRGVYQIPTWELIEWLQNEIKGRSAIEICAGRAGLGRYLGIRMVDNYLHTWPEVRAVFKQLRQPPSIPTPDVECMDANRAIAVYRPQVVIGAWVTQKRLHDGEDQAHPFGPDEHDILEAGCTYIHVGDLSAHGWRLPYL